LSSNVFKLFQEKLQTAVGFFGDGLATAAAFFELFSALCEITLRNNF